ncbi:ribosomal protein L14 [Nadsonia fulvescens var. elongata DSM 6958]|uniref:Large ribosomal subunit protein uL14m n=1 Tax=Nadsonia fulvescens var. elongata DSM 6958 TaxID=857566 RepID=A0A1E3PGV0_9ASCO|nr:ribosomal protein L14 [Nadsonia fulvescens var. elongata DSM 6958]
MLLLKSMINVIDNSGALLVECVNVLKKGNKSHASVGDRIVCVVQKAKPIPLNATNNTQKVRRGDVRHAVIVRTKGRITRNDGSFVAFDDNACVLINANQEPVGSRISGVIAKELKEKGFNKVASLAPKMV